MIYEKILENILKIKKKEELQDVIWGSFYDLNKKCKKGCGRKIKITLLTLQCNGNGDLIFAMKLRNFLLEWYNAKVIIVSPAKENLIKLGMDPKYVIGLEGTKSKNLQCRRLRRLHLSNKVEEQDLFFVAPMQMDFDPRLDDVKSMFPYANKLNTFSFSEYNDDLNKNFTFNTGVGEDREGIFFTKTNVSSKRLSNLPNPYALIYVAEDIDNVDRCIFGFSELVAKKYRKYKKLDVVVPKWVDYIPETFIDRLSEYYDNINIVLSNKNTEKIYESDGNSVLTFRADILPVPNTTMLNLMKNSVDDILVTGDQSISDVLSCCPNKNIYYQIVDWKMDFAENLAELMPNKYLSSVKTSCGTLEAIHYKSNYKKFIKEWDFKKLAKPKLDAIILSAVALKEDDIIHEISDIILKSKSLDKIKDKVEDLFV